MIKLGRFGWSWWELAICVQGVRGEHSWHEEVDGTVVPHSHEWDFEANWQSCPLSEWGGLFLEWNKTAVTIIGEDYASK